MGAVIKNANANPLGFDLEKVKYKWLFQYKFIDIFHYQFFKLSNWILDSLFRVDPVFSLVEIHKIFRTAIVMTYMVIACKGFRMTKAFWAKKFENGNFELETINFTLIHEKSVQIFTVRLPPREKVLLPALSPLSLGESWLQPCMRITR